MSENEQRPSEPTTDPAVNSDLAANSIGDTEEEQASLHGADSARYSEAALRNRLLYPSRSSFMPDSPPRAGTPIVDADPEPTRFRFGVDGDDIGWSPRRILWEPSTRHNAEAPLEPLNDSQRRVTFSRTVGILYPPQTPTHTPIMSPEPAGGALDLDSRITRLDLAANRATTRHHDQDEHLMPEVDRNHNQEGNESSGPEHVRPHDLSLVPGDGDEDGEYEVGRTVIVHLGPDRVSPETGSRLNLTLPNPGNLPTYQLLMTVPYHAHGQPVRMEIDIPHHDASDRDTNLLMFQVLPHLDDIDGGPSESINRRATNTPPPPHSDDFAISRVQHIRAVEAYVAQLPPVETENLPEPHDRQCGICREDYGSAMQHHEQGPEHAIRLPCNHVLGHACLLRWLCGEPRRPGNTNCPVCRRELDVYRSSRPRAVDEDEDQTMRLFESLRVTAHQEPPEISVDTQPADDHDWEHMHYRTQLISREAALIDELIPQHDRVRLTTYEEHRAALFEQLQRRGYLRPPHAPQVLVEIAEGREQRIFDVLRGWGAHWHLSFGWMMNGRRVSGPRLDPAERQEYVRYHMRTNVTHPMYGASPQQLSVVDHLLEPYAREEGLDYP